MSVDLSFYTVFGLKSDWNDDFIDAYNEIYETFDGNTVEVVMDGMCGEYIVFGEVLSSDSQFQEDTSFTEINISALEDRETRYKTKFKEDYPDFYHLIDKPFKLICFTHYS
jgi:hypothetical protein